MLEADLEEPIANEPELLCLADAGVVYNQLAVFRQVQVGAMAGHTAIPDLLMLTDYGDVIIVEGNHSRTDSGALDGSGGRGG